MFNLNRKPSKERIHHTYGREPACNISSCCQNVEFRTLLRKAGKRRLSQLTATNAEDSGKKGEAQHCGQLFNRSTTDKVKLGKWPTATLYVNELLN